MADVTLLSWINAEVERALLLVRDCIAKFSAESRDEVALRPCPEHLHQVSGALRMVGLSGATLVCETIEGAFAGFADTRPSPETIGVIDRAVLALKDFVADLARGQADVPLRLFPVYRDLARLNGGAGPSEKDLFFPDLSMPVPNHRRPKELPQGTVSAFVQKQRALFQKGLLAWLRNPPAGLDEMRRSCNQLHKISAQLPGPQAVWWVAGAFLDALQNTADAEWLAGAKALGNKIDRQMRDGTDTVNEALVREMLYAIAKAGAATPRLKEVRQYYQLDSQFPQADQGKTLLEFDAERLEAELFDLHSRLEALKRGWVQYISGEHKTAGRFRELVNAFKAKAKDLGNQHFLKLLDAISLVAAKLPDPYPRQTQVMVIEMASAFLLVEHVIDNFTSPSPDLTQQIGLMGGWLLDAATGKSTGEPPSGLRPDLSERIGALHLRSQVAKEILANLQHVEQVLDTFSRDASKLSTLPELGPYLRQMHGALVVIGMNKAAEALNLCEKLIADCAAGAGSADDMDWIAEALSSVGFYLEPCRHGREPGEEAIALFFRRYEKRHAPLSLDTTMRLKSPVSAGKAEAAPAPEVKRPQVDADLLEVFLEEAGEVLQTIDKTLPECKTNPQDREAMTTVRRAFHTLKGSGRMVGLMDMGEIAWEVEQVMNRWLEEKLPASAALLEMVDAASKSFAVWIGRLREGKLAGEVDGKHIVAMSAKLKSGTAPELFAAPPARPAPKLPASVPHDADVTIIGGITLPRGFFDIYAKEAAQHVAELEMQWAEWRKMPGADAPHEMMRAAHTLASSSRTAGFSEVADLAAALEHWTALAGQTIEAADTALVQAAIAKLKAMVAALAGRAASPTGDEMQHLQAMIARMEAHPAPPVEPRQSQPAAQRPGAPKLAVVPPASQPMATAFQPEATAAVPAHPADVTAGGRERRVIRDDVDEQLLPVFLEEAEELVPHIGSDLRDWKANPKDENVIASLKRLLHTMKGSARMAGAIRLGELCHLMESGLEAALEADAYPPSLWENLEDKMDRLSSGIELLRAPVEPAAVPAPAAAPAIAAAAPAAADSAADAAAAPAAAPAAPAPAPRAAPLPSLATMLRVNSDTLDHLINESGEIAIARSRIESEMRIAKQSLTDLHEGIARLRGQLREVEVQADSQMQSRQSVVEERSREFDPLEFDRYTRLQELTRMMAETLADIASVQQSLVKTAGDTDAALLSQGRTSRFVQQELMRVRAVPFATLSERLYRIVRQTARDTEKKVELAIEGGEVEVDRGVLDRVGAPLEHMLRNAIAHGIELPAERVAAGKPEAGKITISLRQESNEIALVLADDGAGLNLDKLRQKGIEAGALGADDNPTDAQLAALVFVSGVSTADKVTELAGRGVGMDVVRSEIASIGGRVDITTTRGKGTGFAIYLPLTLAVTQAVLVRCGSSLIAISSVMVEQVLRLKAGGLNELYKKGSAGFQDRVYPAEIVEYNSVLLLRSGIQRVAVHVDELLASQEIVVKNLGQQLQHVPGVVGATVIADGTIVLIMNPVHLANRLREQAEKTVVGARAPRVSAAATKPVSPTVMVVDDSLTVRKFTTRLLERQGYQVLTAKDGVDALEQMKESIPGVMLVDIEMPRMDGFDLTRSVRADARLKGVPIIIISSRTADKHRGRAAELGANASLGKPFPEAELLQEITKYLQAA